MSTALILIVGLPWVWLCWKMAPVFSRWLARKLGTERENEIAERVLYCEWLRMHRWRDVTFDHFAILSRTGRRCERCGRTQHYHPIRMRHEDTDVEPRKDADGYY